jgi:F-box/WD-40 domain protein 12/13/14/15/16/17/19
MWSVLVPGCRDLLFIDSPGQFSLQVFYMSSLLRTSEFSDPVSTVLEFSLCKRAFWTPRREDRITLMSRRGRPIVTRFETFDMKLEENGNKTIVKGKP